MRVGRVERSWVRNCLAIGLAQGFIEPLEATALHIVLKTVEEFIAEVDSGGMDEAARDRFNDSVAWRYEGIRDYIVCHYRTALRRDSDYWRDAAAITDLSDSLKRIITTWFSGWELDREVAAQNIDAFYSAVSWHCLLAGYGNFPDATKLRPPGPDAALVDMDAIDRLIAESAKDFPPHAEALGMLEDAA
jgi:hypothetical protein